MIPLAMTREELERMRAIVDKVAKEVAAEKKSSVTFHFGTMIELPRAALRAGELAETAEFFSFGTNDLTQTTLGISRDDAENRFLAQYVEEGVVDRNPFATVDQKGVGELVALGCQRGRATR